MAPPSRAAGMKQQSISKFFTPRSINGLAATLERSQPQSQPQPRQRSQGQTTQRVQTTSRAGSKRALDEEDDKNSSVEGDEPKRPRRSRAGPRRAIADDEDDEEEGGNTHDDGKSAVELGAPRTSIPSSGTERFAFVNGKDPNAMAVDEDENDVRARQEMHRRFVAKLGNPDSMPRHQPLDAEPAMADGEDDGGDEEDEAPPPPLPKGRAGAKKGKAKLTPMEMQFLDIKRKHMDAVLIVEVGYKFRFFGEDARIASKELGIVCIPGKYRYDEHPSEAHLDRFASASIPVHRLPVHAKRLVAAGYKVGVVRQVETAALKKAGDNRNAPFVRKLTNLYTKGTYIDDTAESEVGTMSTSSGGYLLCVTETAAGSASGGIDEKVDVGILAVQPATGDIIYDSFEDGFMRSELETRLLHISPCEFLLVGEVSGATDKLVQHLSGTSTNVFGDRSRVERVGRSKAAGSEAYSEVTAFYAEKTRAGWSTAAASDGGDDAGRAQALLDKVLGLPESVTICLAAMMRHLTEYGLEHIFDLTQYFESFGTRSHMLISGTTLESLEVYRNSTDRSERGSLFWAVDKTVTRFGRRLLRKWVGRPLLDGARLEERVSAVEELLGKASTAPVERLVGVLKATAKMDLERSLIRIYYGKCTRPELVRTLQTLQRVATQYAGVRTAEATGFSSRLLSGAALALAPMLDVVVPYLDRINADAARRDDKYGFLREGEQTEDMTDHGLSIAAVEQELDAHRRDAAGALGRKTPVEYATVAGIEYLVEVANADIKRVPASWAKISGTKKVSRFHTPEVVRLVAERDQHREALAAACDAAFRDLLAALAGEYQPLRDAVAALASLDCLLSLAKVAATPGYTRPTILPASSPPSLTISGGRHPTAELLLPDGYIPFSATLKSPSPLAYLITGPNMGGKSSFVRAVALLVLLAQVGSFVPADSLALTLCDAIFTRMGAQDNLFGGESTFMVELGETARMLRAATPRSLVVLDELGRGTSTHDGAAIAHAVLDHVVAETRCLTLFITHYQNLARVADSIGNGAVRNVHMRFSAGGRDGEQRTDDQEEEEITFLYEVAEGVAHRSYGLNVARLARVPRRVIEVAAHKSRELEAETRGRMVRSAMVGLKRVLGGEGGVEGLERLVQSIELL